VASLASDTNLLAGYESAIIDNTTDGFRQANNRHQPDSIAAD